MFDGIKRNIAGGVVRNFISSLATSKDTQTTIVGAIAAVIISINGLDWSKLLSGDANQIALVISALAVWGVGVMTTKENSDGHTTILGIIAASAQAYIGNFSTALTVGLCGYFSNKLPQSSPPAKV